VRASTWRAWCCPLPKLEYIGRTCASCVVFAVDAAASSAHPAATDSLDAASRPGRHMHRMRRHDARGPRAARSTARAVVLSDSVLGRGACQDDTADATISIQSDRAAVWASTTM